MKHPSGSKLSEKHKAERHGELEGGETLASDDSGLTALRA